MFFVKKEEVSDFQDRCAVAVFLKLYPQIHFMQYVGKNHFVGEFGNYGVGHIYLFNTPNKEDPYGTVFRSKNYKSRKGFNYEVFNEEFLHEYRLFADNPFDYIQNHFFREEWEARYEGLFVSTPPEDKGIDILYKYKSDPNDKDEKSVKIFRDFVNGKLTFVNPSTCNDPFDCECEIPLHDAIPVILYKAMQKTKYSDSVVKVIPIEKITEIAESYHNENGDSHEVNRALFEDLIDLIYQKEPLPDKKKELVIDYCIKMSSQVCNLKNNFRILCLARDPHDILMWGYYGDSGKGICCGHRAQDINNGILAKYNNICVYGDIYYPLTDKRPKFHVKSVDIADDIMSFIIECTFTKYHNWQHEKEFRYVLMGEDFGSDYITIDSKTECIYLGCKNNEVPFYKLMTMTPSPYRLRMHPQKYELV